MTMELDAPKSQDLSKVMVDSMTKLAGKNQEELGKYQSQQTEESTTVVTSQTAEL